MAKHGFLPWCLRIDPHQSHWWGEALWLSKVAGCLILWNQMRRLMEVCALETPLPETLEQCLSCCVEVLCLSCPSKLPIKQSSYEHAKAIFRGAGSHALIQWGEVPKWHTGPETENCSHSHPSASMFNRAMVKALIARVNEEGTAGAQNPTLSLLMTATEDIDITTQTNFKAGMANHFFTPPHPTPCCWVCLCPIKPSLAHSAQGYPCYESDQDVTRTHKSAMSLLKGTLGRGL